MLRWADFLWAGLALCWPHASARFLGWAGIPGRLLRFPGQHRPPLGHGLTAATPLARIDPGGIVPGRDVIRPIRPCQRPDRSALRPTPPATAPTCSSLGQLDRSRRDRSGRCTCFLVNCTIYIIRYRSWDATSSNRYTFQPVLSSGGG
jgi:hypothetical protein